jgi:hypothetical protein
MASRVPLIFALGRWNLSSYRARAFAFCCVDCTLVNNNRVVFILHTLPKRLLPWLLRVTSVRLRIAWRPSYLLQRSILAQRRIQ